MKKIRRQVVSTLGCSYPVLLILLLVGLFAALAPHSFHNVSVTHAQSETEAPLPGGGGDAGGPAAPVVTGTAYSAPDFVRFTWERVEGAEEYEVLWRRGAGGTWAHVAQSPLASTGYDFYQESAGTTLYLLIRAIAADGKVSAWSNLAQATVPGTATQASTPTATVSTLTAPRLSARHAGADAIDLSWTPVSGAVRYELWTWWASDPGWQNIDDSLPGTSYRHSGLAPGRTYFYALRSVDADGVAGEWTQSPYPNATVPESGASTSTPTPTPTVTSTPTSGPTQTPTPTATVSTQSAPRLSARHAGADAIDLSWTPVSGAVRYELWTWWASDPGWQNIDDSLPGTSYRHSGLAPGRTYFYALRSVDADGVAGEWTQSPYPNATVPESGASTSTPTPTPTVTSTPTSGPTQTPTPTPTVTSTPTSDPTPTQTPTATVSTQSAPRLSARHAGADAIDLSWTPVSGAVRYELWTWWASDPGWQNIDDSLPGTSYRHSGLTPGRTYFYALRSVDADGVAGEWTQSPYPNATVPESDASMSTPTPTVTASAATTAAQRAALVALYQATDGANWTHNDNWLSASPLSTWYGVSTDTSGHVTRLFLSNNRLNGQLPDLSALTNLTGLYLNDNQLSGSIPDLRTLSKLTELYLYSNQLAGQIPDLRSNATLEVLHLASNQLAGPIPDLSALTNLTGLYLYHNQLSGPIPDLSMLTELTALHLSSNRLTGQIPDLSRLTNLTALYLNNNLLTGPFPDLSALTNLTVLSLIGNQLCVPEDADLSGSNTVVAIHLQSLILPSCSDDPSVVQSTSTATPTATATTSILATVTSTATATTSTLATATPTATAIPPVPAEERAALVALYSATDGANWTHNDNWLSAAPLSTWYGVSTDTNGHVTKLHLNSNQLSGQIPDLSSLTQLTNLLLSNNQLSGQIPDLSSLTQLTNLLLSNNQLSGQIPDLSTLTQLTNLSFGYNQLSGQISNLSALTNLTALIFHYNQLSGPFPDLSTLTNLTSLSLAGNQLSGPIPDLSSLTNLTGLYLNHTELSGPIPDLSALTNLRELALIATQLCLSDGASLSHPNSVVDAHLKSLNLPSCSPVGPEERAALVALYNATDGASWTHNDNWLSTEPIGTWHGVFTDHYGHVERIVLGNNGLSGTIPDLSALTNLKSLILDSNRLSGQIPDLSKLIRLQRLDLRSNELTGQIPNLKALTNLTSVSLASNTLSGQVPELGTLANLRWLHLGRNQLSGQIPELRALTNLSTLILSSNQLSGQIPELKALTQLTHLDFSSNQLSGQVPELKALTQLTHLDFSSNQLSGQVPELKALTRLTNLDFSSNQLTGQIPELKVLTQLTSLNFSSNQLTGQIPDLSTLTSLGRLYLSNNQMTGQIPALGALTRLVRLELSSNQMTGQIPALSALTQLTHLDFSSNQLTGQIPDLSTLTSLGGLNLSSNQLTGPILDLNLLTELTGLDLSNNQLTGPFPDLGALTNLSRLNLSDNRLCLPAGYDFSGSNRIVTAHLNRLNLATCTDDEVSAFPTVPQNLAATVGSGQVMLTWDAVANAASYELRTWDSFDRQWGPIGGSLSRTTYTHTVQTDGRNYYYQVRARSANGIRGAWSEQLYVAVVATEFPPPSPSLGFDMYYQKYMDVGGVVVVAPSRVSDEQMIRSREIITGMLVSRSDILATMAANNTLIYIQDDFKGIAVAWIAQVPVDDPNCDTFIHEFAHLIDFAINAQSGGGEFDTKLRALYQAALNAGLWRGFYASTNAAEYWAETVKFWLWESMPLSLVANYPTLADYDPEAAKLIEEVFGDAATVPASCKP